MAKINFNVPLLNEKGEEVQRVKMDQKKLKKNEQGQLVAQTVFDKDGTAVLETVYMRDMLVQILSTPFEGDEKVPFGDRVKRGKLCRKVATSSTANYNPKEISTIEDLSAKIGSTALLTQLDVLINGDADESDVAEGEAAEAENTKKTEEENKEAA